MGMFADPLSGGMFGQAGDQSGLGGILMDYLRNVMSGQVAASGPLGQNFYDPNRSFAQNALDPRAIENATDIAMSMSTGPIRAYHGSPHDFDKFDMSKIGTGEGAQAYGHGIYFAEAEPVARSYRDALGPDAAMNALDGFLRRNRGVNLRAEEVAERLSGTPAAALAQDPKAIESLQKLLPQYLPNAAVMGSDLTHYRYLDDAAQRLIPGKMYEVNINARPEQFLRYEAPLKQQPEPVRRALQEIPWGEPYLNSTFTGGQIAPQSAAGAAELSNAGIPGIRYLDQGSRVDPVAIQRQIDMHRKNLASGSALDAVERQAWESRIAELQAELIKPQTSNYVVFDPSIIEILRKYGILGPLAVPGTLAPFMGDQQQ